MAYARAAVKRVAEEAAAEAATHEQVATAADDNDDGNLDLTFAPQLEPTRLTGRRHCARAPGAPIVMAFG